MRVALLRARAVQRRAQERARAVGLGVRGRASACGGLECCGRERGVVGGRRLRRGRTVRSRRRARHAAAEGWPAGRLGQASPQLLPCPVPMYCLLPFVCASSRADVPPGSVN